MPEKATSRGGGKGKRPARPAPTPALDNTTSTVHTGATVRQLRRPATEGNGMGKGSLREDVYSAAMEVLSGSGNAEQLSEKIVEAFYDRRRRVAANVGVREDVRRGIEEDLRAGGYSYNSLREKYGVGISTVQRVARELSNKGVTVRTAGQTLVA